MEKYIFFLSIMGRVQLVQSIINDMLYRFQVYT